MLNDNFRKHYELEWLSVIKTCSSVLVFYMDTPCHTTESVVAVP